MEQQTTTYLLSQGVLGVAVIMLVAVCNKLYNKTESLQKRIEELQDLRLSDSKAHAGDYQKMALDNQDALQKSSQSSLLLSEKIEVVKGQR